MLREALVEIFEKFGVARAQPFGGNPFAQYVRHRVPELIRQGVKVPSTFLVEASAGKGNWVDGPWVAVFDPLVTETAQEGYYPVYLFARDLGAVFLSLNQGVTALKDEVGVAAARQTLESRSSILRARLEGSFEDRFDAAPIALKPSKRGSLLELYEHGHAVGKRYAREQLPPNHDLVEDLEAMLRLYQIATARGGASDFSAEAEGATDGPPMDAGDSGTHAEQKRYFFHRRIERNRRLAAEAKRVHGCVCQVCDFDFAKMFGELGAGYIEAHHKTPLAELPEGEPVPLSPRDDFAVVCANCHRMIHRRGAPAEFADFVLQYGSAAQRRGESG